VAVNCGAISESLLESELFGHAKGAFTGAASARRGLFEETGDGTLLLDEIGEVSPRLQSSLLRVLETGEIRPVGSSRILRAQCRILASTNADLDRLAQESRFRTDLLFRLRRLRIHLPPLRDRPEDIIPLARHFLDLGRPAGTRASIAPDLALALREQPWPGNVRELRNVVERMRLMNSDKLAYEVADLEPETRAVPPARSARPAGPSATPIRLRPAHARAAARPLKQGRSGVRRLAILRELFAQHRLMTRSEVAQTLEISPNTATRDLQALAREGLIERVSPSASPRSVYFRLRPGR
jgi:DNA-binding NtrC family response regulator